MYGNQLLDGIPTIHARADSIATARNVGDGAKPCPLPHELGKHHTTACSLAIVASALAAVSACSNASSEARKRISAEYDEATGQLRLLKYDANGNGKVDTWSYMDGPRVKRIEIDSDEDGKIDRWEYYDADRQLEKVGFSRARDGKEDAWSFIGPDGSIVRIEVSTRRDGKVNRTEHYQNGLLTTAEEDSDGDGAIDKWENYDGERLAWVAFDTVHRGTPDRRLIYSAAGAAQMEFDADGDGRFVAGVVKQ
jgi:hypothetical protein